VAFFASLGVKVFIVLAGAKILGTFKLIWLKEIALSTSLAVIRIWTSACCA